MIKINEILKLVQEINPSVKDGDNLITSGIYNSIEIVSLVVKLEDTFGIRISPLDINAEHFNSVEAITGLINLYLEGDEKVRDSSMAVEIDLDDLLEETNSFSFKEEKIEKFAKAIELDVSSASNDTNEDENVIDEESAFRLPEDAKCVLDFLENAAAQVPNKIALMDAFENRISFAELLQKSKMVGFYLIEKYGCVQRPFVVLERRNVNSIIMFLGVIWSGNYYVALGENLPLERISEMIDTVKPEGVLWDYNAQNDSIFDLNTDLNIYDEMLEEEPDESKLLNLRQGHSYEEPLFGVFTSGTTGTPKCIIKSHGAMVDFITTYVKLFGFEHHDKFGSKLSLMFDAITKDIYTVLYCGAQLYIMPRGNVLPPDDARLIEKEKITSVVWTPSLLRNFSQLHILEQMKLPTLKKVLFVGEALPAKYINYWLKYKPDTKYINLYGTSEMTGNCLYEIINAPVENDIVPLKEVFPGYEISLVNEEGTMIKEAGEAGEICVSGKLLCLDQIGEALSLPIMDGKRTYCTGDMVRIIESGEYLFQSRKDYCFKHAGYRLNPGEIEEAFYRLEFVDVAVCLYDSIRQIILLIWQGNEDNTEQLYEFAQKALPSYMIPGKYVYLRDIPINSNGKVDKSKLMRWINDTQGKCDTAI